MVWDLRVYSLGFEILASNGLGPEGSGFRYCPLAIDSEVMERSIDLWFRA